MNDRRLTPPEVGALATVTSIAAVAGGLFGVLVGTLESHAWAVVAGAVLVGGGVILLWRERRQSRQRWALRAGALALLGWLAALVVVVADSRNPNMTEAAIGIAIAATTNTALLWFLRRRWIRRSSTRRADSAGNKHLGSSEQLQVSEATSPGFHIREGFVSNPVTLQAAAAAPARVAEQHAEVRFELDSIGKQTTEAKPVVDSSDKYRGIGGWLALFCFAVLAGRPWRTVTETLQFELDITMARISGEYRATELNTLLIAGRTQTVLLILLTLYGIFVGVRLLQEKPSAIKHVKRLLIAGLVYVIGSAIVALSLWAIVDWRALASIAIIAIWWAYFARSKRVRATFGRNL